ncbi:MAG: hypothetical protein ACYC2Z_05785 [Candidatus Nanopelagicales bacterium]
MPAAWGDEGLAWPPTAEELYLPAGPARPVMQGDVFDDVPFVKAKRGSRQGDPPNVTAERRRVAVLGHPCDIYSQGRPVRVQTVVPVITATAAGIPDNWDGAFTFAPMPDLLGDGVMHAADLRVAANIDAFYLDRANRVRCLSRLGWAAFRQRLGLASGRLLNHLDDLVSVGQVVWQEMQLWQAWNEAGLDEPAFQEWLDGREANLGGFSRRAALERGMFDVVAASLAARLRA